MMTYIYRPTKYDSPRDEVLDWLVRLGWEDRNSIGAVYDIGYYSAISIGSPRESIRGFLEAVDAGFEVPDEPKIAITDLIGHFILCNEGDQGFVTVTEYASGDDLDADWANIEDEYVKFYEENPEDDF